MHIENKSYQADKMKRSRAKESSLLSLHTLKEESQSSELRLQYQLKKTNCFYLTEMVWNTAAYVLSLLFLQI